MNNILKNIFGMHLGCDFEYYGKRYKLGCIDINSGDNECIMFALSTLEPSKCKLVLRNLKSISNKDMMEVTEGFFTIGIKPIELIATNGTVYMMYNNKAGEVVNIPLSGLVSFKLATMGYDIDLVPEENKIIEE